jgi:hypothetical protein
VIDFKTTHCVLDMQAQGTLNYAARVRLLALKNSTVIWTGECKGPNTKISQEVIGSDQTNSMAIACAEELLDQFLEAIAKVNDASGS